MYANGYDLRHLATMTISPAVAETLVRTYDAIRTGRDGGDVGKSDVRAKLKLSTMLALTHGLLASSNILKTALYGWNPTALNIAQFVALAKQMLSLVKLSAERDNLIQDRLATGWKSLLAESTGASTARLLHEQADSPPADPRAHSTIASAHSPLRNCRTGTISTPLSSRRRRGS